MKYTLEITFYTLGVSGIVWLLHYHSWQNNNLYGSENFEMIVLSKSVEL